MILKRALRNTTGHLEAGTIGSGGYSLVVFVNNTVLLCYVIHVMFNVPIPWEGYQDPIYIISSNVTNHSQYVLN
jgi:hypothetical protein